MLTLWRAMDDLMREEWPRSAFSRWPFDFRPGQFEKTAFSPAVDIYEEGNAYVVSAELPGVKAEEVDLKLDGHVLTISGKRQFEKKEESEGYQRLERHYGSFSRSFTLPETVDVDAIKAELKEGVLFVRLPKSEESHARKISISESPSLSEGTEPESGKVRAA